MNQCELIIIITVIITVITWSGVSWHGGHHSGSGRGTARPRRRQGSSRGPGVTSGVTSPGHWRGPEQTGEISCNIMKSDYVWLYVRDLLGHVQGLSEGHCRIGYVQGLVKGEKGIWLRFLRKNLNIFFVWNWNARCIFIFIRMQERLVFPESRQGLSKVGYLVSCQDKLRSDKLSLRQQ